MHLVLCSNEVIESLSFIVISSLKEMNEDMFVIILSSNFKKNIMANLQQLLTKLPLY